MLSIEKLMMMSDEEIKTEETLIMKMLANGEAMRDSMKKSIDFCAVDYDSDEWMMYEEILYDIEYCEKDLEVINDYYDNYDYYWDMSSELI